MRPINLTRGDALLVVDVQNDFLPGGAVPVPEGGAVIAPVNLLIRLYGEHGLPVYVSRDWYPPAHPSFVAHGGRSPPHCVAHTHGAAFPDALALPPDVVAVSRASGSDTRSAFRDTTLAAQLQVHGVGRLAVCGLATDYSVLDTVSDALALGFRTLLVLDAVRPVEAGPGDGDRAIALMTQRGAVAVRTRPPSLLNEAALVEPVPAPPGHLL